MKNVVIYTDGACSGNPGPGGCAAVLMYRGRQKEIAEGYSLTTNNRMELRACIIGLNSLKEACRVDLYSDSRYLTDGIEKGWAKRWRENEWRRNKKDKALNADLWEEILILISFHEVSFFWVRGHADDPVNELCDRLARGAAEGETLRRDEGYETELGLV